MDNLDHNTIIRIINQFNHNLIYHNCTIGYLKQILNNFFIEINSLTNILSIFNWVKNTLPESLSSKLSDNIESILNNTFEDIQIIKDIIITFLIYNIVEHLPNILKDSDKVVLPWDILHEIVTNCSLSLAFNINDLNDEPKLPVNIKTVTGGSSIKMLSQNFFGGLLLFASINNNCIISMYGSYFSSDYMKNGNNRFNNREYGIYNVEIENFSYSFDSLDFLQGFITGASLVNDDHRKYWKNLTIYNENTDTKELIKF